MTTQTIVISTIQPRYLPLSEAAAYCGMKPKEFRQCCGATPIKPPVGKGFVFDREELDQWMQSLKECGRISNQQLIDAI